MLRNRLAIWLIILSSLVLGLDGTHGKSKSDNYQLSERELKTIGLVKSAVSARHNETKIRALIDIKRLPTEASIASNTTTILVDGDQREKIARKHHHYGGMFMTFIVKLVMSSSEWVGNFLKIPKILEKYLN